MNEILAYYNFKRATKTQYGPECVARINSVQSEYTHSMCNVTFRPIRLYYIGAGLH